MKGVLRRDWLHPRIKIGQWHQNWDEKAKYQEEWNAAQKRKAYILIETLASLIENRLDIKKISTKNKVM